VASHHANHTQQVADGGLLSWLPRRFLVGFFGHSLALVTGVGVAMKLSSQDLRSLRQQIVAVDAQLRAVQRRAALQGLDLRSEWDQLIGQRIKLSRQFVDGSDPLAPRQLLFLFTPLGIVAAVLLWFRSGRTVPVAAGFIAGLVSSLYLLIGRKMRRSHVWNHDYGLQPDRLN
jgi:hypothetical protein